MQDIFESVPPRAGGRNGQHRRNNRNVWRTAGADEGDTAGSREGAASTGGVSSMDWNNRVESSHFGQSAYTGTFPAFDPLGVPRTDVSIGIFHHVPSGLESLNPGRCGGIGCRVCWCAREVIVHRNVVIPLFIYL